MAERVALSFDSDTMRVSGDIDFTNVVALCGEGDHWLRHQAPQRCLLDLGGVGRCNSAATTLLLSWLRAANSVGKRLVIVNVPEALRSLMDLGGLIELLPAE